LFETLLLVLAKPTITIKSKFYFLALFMLRESILQRYTDERIINTIAHDFSIQLKAVFGVIRKLILLYGMYYWAIRLWDHPYIVRWTAGVAFILMIKYIIDFFNLYLDALVMTGKWVKVFVRESLMEYKMDLFEWEHLQVVSFEQRTFMDKLFWTGDIYIALTNNFEFSFDGVHNPQKAVQLLLTMKERFVWGKQEHEEYEPEQDHTYDKEKFNVLVETLGEVIVEYMDKKKIRDMH